MPDSTTRARLTRTVQLRFTDEQYEDLREMAQLNEISVGQLVRELVTQAMLDHLDLPIPHEDLHDEVVEQHSHQTRRWAS